MCTFKNLEEIWKTWNFFDKTSGNFVYSYIIGTLFLYKENNDYVVRVFSVVF